MEHYELVQEMGTVERMSTQERLKHARKRRCHQLKKFGQYERQLDKESSKKKKNQEKQQLQQPKRVKRSNRGNVKFAPNIALLEAAARGDQGEVKMLLERGVSPDVTNEDGLTALHQCCIDNSEEMMKLLLDFNANVNACDSEMWTPLHAAATCGHMMLCKYLIDRGAELLAVNADGNMPYDICEDEVTLDHIETEMAKRGITQEQIDSTRLAGEHRMLADVKEFVSAGGDLEKVDHMGATLLHIAAANGYVEVAEFLLDNHVSVDVQDNESWQPIHAAAYWAQQEILELLVESGADLDSKTKNGETPFDLCEDPDLKQKILDMKDEIETKRSIRQQRLGSQRKQRVSSRNLGQSSDSLYSSNTSLNMKSNVSASMRRSSMRGDKSQLFRKEHKEEALNFGLNLMNEEDLHMVAEEEHDVLPSIDLDQVRVVVTCEDDDHTQPPSTSPPPISPPTQDASDAVQSSPPTSTTTTGKASSPPPQPAPAITTITITSQPAVKPQSQDPRAGVSATPQSQPTVPSANSQNPPLPTQSSASSQGRSSRAPPSSDDAAPRPAAQSAAGEKETATKPTAAAAQNSSGPPPATRTAPQVLPRQSVYPAPSSNERRQSGSTLSDLKRQRSNSRESLLDLAVQNMFLESVQGGRQGNSSLAGRDKAKNGHHHHHNNNAAAVHYSAASDGQLRRFVAPTSAPVVGGEDEKHKCCVIL